MRARPSTTARVTVLTVVLLLATLAAVETALALSSRVAVDTSMAPARRPVSTRELAAKDREEAAQARNNSVNNIPVQPVSAAKCKIMHEELRRRKNAAEVTEAAYNDTRRGISQRCSEQCATLESKVATCELSGCPGSTGLACCKNLTKALHNSRCRQNDVPFVQRFPKLPPPVSKVCAGANKDVTECVAKVKACKTKMQLTHECTMMACADKHLIRSRCIDDQDCGKDDKACCADERAAYEACRTEAHAGQCRREAKLSESCPRAKECRELGKTFIACRRGAIAAHEKGVKELEAELKRRKTAPKNYYHLTCRELVSTYVLSGMQLKFHLLGVAEQMQALVAGACPPAAPDGAAALTTKRIGEGVAGVTPI